jgi:hypothetical protein
MFAMSIVHWPHAHFQCENCWCYIKKLSSAIVAVVEGRKQRGMPGENTYACISFRRTAARQDWRRQGIPRANETALARRITLSVCAYPLNEIT